MNGWPESFPNRKAMNSEKTCNIAVSKANNPQDKNPTYLLFRPKIKHQHKCKLRPVTLQAEGSSQQRCCATIIAPGFLAFLFKNYQQKVKYSNSILHQSPISSSLSAVRKQSLQPFLSSFFKGLQAGSVRIWINTPKAHIGEATKVLIHA